MRRLVIVLGLVCGALAGLPGVARGAEGGGSGGSQSSVSSPLEAVQRVLDARVAAVRSGVKAAFLATVDPEAPGAFKESQARLFDGLRSLPLESYSLEARTFDSGDLSRRGPGSFLPETRQRMRLRGYDAVDAVDALWLTYVQRGERWYVAADNDLARFGLDSVRGLWDFGPVVAQPLPHFLVLSHPGEATRARALGDMAERALAVHQARWTQPWPGRIPLVVPGSANELSAILNTTIDLSKFVAFVSYGSVRDDGYLPTAPRVYIHDENLAKHTERFQTETLAHELNHAAVAPLSGPFIPSWVHEGVADWLATGQRTNERNRGGAAHVPRDYEFSTGSQGSIVQSYRLSRVAVSTLASARGRAAPAAFVAHLGSVRLAPGSADYHVDAALRRATGLGVPDLERLWRT